MTIRHLNVFIKVADHGSMTGAAKELFIAQPSVSQTIKELEDHYNIKLFERLSKKLYITPEGRELLSYARYIVSLFEEMNKKMRHASKSSRLKIGATVTIGICLLSELCNLYLLDYPDADIETIVDNTRVVEDMVLKSEIDFALVEGPIHSDDIVSEPFMKDELILICGCEHPFRKRGSIFLKELENEKLIVRESGSGTRELFENTMLSRGYDVNIKSVCNSAAAIKEAVLSNMGVSVISRMIVQRELELNKLFHIEIEDAKFKRQFRIIYHKNKFISKFIKDFWNLCYSYEDSFNQ